jgi:hypothetical protein
MNWTRKLSVAAICVIGAATLAVGGAGAQPGGCKLNAPNAAAAGRGCARAWMDANLKLNDLMSVGSHNSYKTTIPPAVLAALRPSSQISLDYAHRPLTEELDAGARQIEIDIYYDPKGGRFSDPVRLREAHIAIDPAIRAAWAKPGFKVMHVPDTDVLSSCVLLTDCLRTIRKWSLAHRDHTPILLMFNAKTDKSTAAGGTDALPFDAAAFDALDAEVRSVLPREALIAPDDVQGPYPTLREAVLAGNWPTLGKARGKVLFALDEAPDKVAIYRGARKSLEGRVFFINTDENSPAAAYLTLNDPLTEGDRIRRDVQAGFIVRTRADADTAEARVNDTRKREAALASGAQWVSTDYLWPDPRFPGAYQVRLPNGAATICNPVRAAKLCQNMPVESVKSAP